MNLVTFVFACIILHFTGSTLSFAAFASLFSSMISHQKKISVVKHFHKHDQFLIQHLKIDFDYKKIHNRVLFIFWLFEASIGSSFVWLFASAYFFNPIFLLYNGHYLLMALITHHQSFQLSIFAIAVEERLKALSEIKLDERVVKRKFLSDVQVALIQLYEIVQEINKNFAFSLLTNYFFLYGSILSNFQWIGLALLGVSYAKVAGMF